MSDFTFFSQDLFWFYFLLVAVIGLTFGSYVSALSYRIPRNISSVIQRSRCPMCQSALSYRDLIPFFSWLFSLGKCRHCKKPVSIRYPLTELSTAGVFVITYLVLGASWHSLLLMLVAVCLMTIIVVDLEHRIIPHITQQYLLLLAMLHWAHTGKPDFTDLLIGLVIALAVGYGLRALWLKLRKKEVLGLGDAKFFLISSIFLGGQLFPLFIFIAGVLGIISGLLWKWFKKEAEFPFAPALCVSLYICLLFPELQVKLFQVIGALTLM